MKIVIVINVNCKMETKSSILKLSHLNTSWCKYKMHMLEKNIEVKMFIKTYRSGSNKMETNITTHFVHNCHIQICERVTTQCVPKENNFNCFMIITLKDM